MLESRLTSIKADARLSLRAHKYVHICMHVFVYVHSYASSSFSVCSLLCVYKYMYMYIPRARRWRTYALLVGEKGDRWTDAPYQIMPHSPWIVPPKCERTDRDRSPGRGTKRSRSRSGSPRSRRHRGDRSDSRDRGIPLLESSIYSYTLMMIRRPHVITFRDIAHVVHVVIWPI